MDVILRLPENLAKRFFIFIEQAERKEESILIEDIARILADKGIPVSKSYLQAGTGKVCVLSGRKRSSK